MISQIFVSLSGPTGAGKSTVLRLLSRHPTIGVVPEPVVENTIEDFDIHRAGRGMALQRAILVGRAAVAKQITRPIVLFDRSPLEDCEVFIELHRQIGSLTEGDIAGLRALADETMSQLGPLAGVVFLHAPPAVLIKRMKEEARPHWLLDSLDLQRHLYRAWFNSLTCPRISMDTSIATVEDTVSRAFKFICSLQGGHS